MTRPLGMLALIAGFTALLAPPVIAAPAASVGTPAGHKAVLDKYCVTCHNARLKTADLVARRHRCRQRAGRRAGVGEGRPQAAHGADAAVGTPRPDKDAYATMVAWLEGELDQDAAARPNPGRTESLHRLNRAEYRNAVRDLLALEIDVASLLPADDMSYGFDNIAGVLKITPSLLERYLAAARQISRVAVGDPKLPPTADTFRLKADLYQDVAFDGAAVRHARRHGDRVPLPARRRVHDRDRAARRRAPTPHQLEVSIDGERVEAVRARRRGAARARGQGYDSEGTALEGARPGQGRPAAPSAVTFVARPSALVEGVREPFLVHARRGRLARRSRAWRR